MAGYFLEQLLSGLVVIPETGLDGPSLKLSYFLLSLIEVKDTSLTCQADPGIEVSGF
jgi:hypothetical protein